jgi:hypothetical protein
MAAAHNADIMQLAQEWEARCSLLTKHSIQLEKRDEKRSSGLRYVLQQQGQKINSLNKFVHFKNLKKQRTILSVCYL